MNTAALGLNGISARNAALLLLASRTAASPSSSDNAAYTAEQEDILYASGDLVRYECNSDSKLISGNSERMCQRDGTWNGTAAECQCTQRKNSNFVFIKHFLIHKFLKLFVQIADVDCGSLKDLDNAVVFYFNESSPSTYQALAAYRCIGNLSLIGNATFYCDYDVAAGKSIWMGETPRCKCTHRKSGKEVNDVFLNYFCFVVDVDCGELQQPAFGAVALVDGNTFYKARAQYTCSANYTLAGGAPSQRVCLESNQWTGTDPICECGYSYRTTQYISTQT